MGSLGDTCVFDTDCGPSLVCFNDVCSASTTGFKMTTGMYIAVAVVVGVVALFAIGICAWLISKRRKARQIREEEANIYRFEHQNFSSQQRQQQQQQGIAYPNQQTNPWMTPQMNTPAPPYGSPSPMSPDAHVYGNPIELDTVEKPDNAHFFELQGDEAWSPLDESSNKRSSKLVGTKKSIRKS